LPQSDELDKSGDNHSRGGRTRRGGDQYTHLGCEDRRGAGLGL